LPHSGGGHGIRYGIGADSNVAIGLRGAGWWYKVEDMHLACLCQCTALVVETHEHEQSGPHWHVLPMLWEPYKPEHTSQRQVGSRR
jgi:hypothetical protein